MGNQILWEIQFVKNKVSLNDLLSREVNLFQNAYDKSPKGAISIIDALTLIKNGKYRKEISAARDTYKREGKSDRYQEEKKKLHAVTFGGVFEPTRKKENLKRHSGLVIADLDQVGNLEEIKQKICSDSYVLACFNSPSDDGLKFLIPIPVVRNDAEYKSYLQPIARHFKEMYDIDIFFDKDGKDICRLCFVSYDPELFLNENAAIFTEKEEAKPGSEHLNSRKSPTRPYPEKYSSWKEQAIKNIVNIIARSQMGNRHASRLKAGYLAGGFVAGGMLTEEEILPLLRGVVAANTDLPIDKAFKDVSDSYKTGKSKPITFEMKEAEFEDWLHRNGYFKYVNNSKDGIENQYVDKTSKNSISVKKRNSYNFWEQVSFKNKNIIGEKLEISNVKLLKFLEKAGFAKIKLGSQYKFVKIKDKSVDIIIPTDMKDFVFDYVRALHQKKREAVESELTRSVKKYFNRATLECLPTIQLEMHSDTIDKCYFYYSNGYIEISADQITFRDYSQLNGYVWGKDILPRNIELREDWEDCNEMRFLKLISDNESRRSRLESLKSILGYLLHRHIPKDGKAVILMDEKIPNSPQEANGGTGKGIIYQFISMLRQTAKEDAVRIQHGNRFNFQKIKHDTSVFFVDEVPQRWDFNLLFSSITDGVEVERKNEDSFTARVKFLLSTNKTIQGEGSSYNRRVFEFELAPFFSDKRKPFDEFNRNLLPDDYSREEWNKFDNMMFHCAQVYLRNGLIDYLKVNIERRKLMDQTCKEFVDWAALAFSGPGDYHRNEMYNKFKDHFPEHNSLKLTKFTKWVNLYCGFQKWKIKPVNKTINGNKNRWFYHISHK
ncbi:MAG: hypothetical protein CV087_20990 [Candidatus Brocadia sp. WS118]|nr:MAG: hypothetical protein CV087_20990 [Candidatus Brocadia sp. WS118]